jgi:hypothetical protein
MGGQNHIHPASLRALHGDKVEPLDLNLDTTSEYVWYGMVWCPSYPLGRNRCDQVVASEPSAC